MSGYNSTAGSTGGDEMEGVIPTAVRTLPRLADSILNFCSSPASRANKFHMHQRINVLNQQLNQTSNTINGFGRMFLESSKIFIDEVVVALKWDDEVKIGHQDVAHIFNFEARLAKIAGDCTSQPRDYLLEILECTVLEYELRRMRNPLSS